MNGERPPPRGAWSSSQSDISAHISAPALLPSACRYFFLTPMSVESALEQCDQLGHSFYLFR